MFRNTEARYYVKSWDANSARTFGLYVIGKKKNPSPHKDSIDCVSIQLEQISEVGNVTNDTKAQTHFLEKLIKYYNFLNRIREDKNKFGIRQAQHTQTSSNSSTIAADSSNGVTNTRCCRYRCMRS
jgi:flagellar capping protein FliD